MNFSMGSLDLPGEETVEELSKEDRDRIDKALIKHLKGLLDLSIKAHPTKDFIKYQKYYLGNFDSATNANLQNNCNIIKGIIETKVGLTIDANITTSVLGKPSSFSDLQTLKSIEDVGDILNEILGHINRTNKIDSLTPKFVRDCEKYGSGFAKVSWDETLDNGVGDVSIQCISPMNFFPDPSSKTIQDCNFIFIKNSFSPLTLKKKYPDRVKDIDKLIKDSSKDNDENIPSSAKSGNNITTVNSGNFTQQYYVSQTGGVENIDKSIDVWEAYLKDDTIFYPNSDDSPEDVNSKIEIGFKYPNGRVIIFAGDGIIFEDKPIDYPFGFPFEKLTVIESDTIWGQGDIQDLINIQDRINLAYSRVRMLIAKYVSIVLADAGSGITTDNELINQFFVMVEPGVLSSGREPRILTNNTLSQINELINYIATLKADAKQIARVNDMMIAGERPTGVNSGQMVQDLNESPMTSIREIQRQLFQFMINISNKCITLAQLYYKRDRVIRLADGKNFIGIVNNGDNQTLVKVSSPDKDLQQEVTAIQGDLSISDYECQIVAGSEMPRNRTSQASVIMQLAGQGYFGPPDSIEAKKIVFSALDLPGWRAYIQQLETEKDKAMSAPPPPPPVQNISTAFKDLPSDAQLKLLELNGLIQPQQPSSSTMINMPLQGQV